MKPNSKTILLGFMLFSAMFVLTPLAWSETTIQLNQNEHTLFLSQNEQPLMQYRFKNVPYKPYLKTLYTPNGLNVTRDQLGQMHDHPHHHGFFFAISVNGISFWTENEESGKQIHQKFTKIQTTQTDTQLTARFTEELVWQGPDQTRLLDETRTLSYRQPSNDQFTMLKWRSVLQCPEQHDSVIISGAHYYGLGTRFIKEMDEIGDFINSDRAEGSLFRGEEYLYEADWCAYRSQRPQPVTVVFFDSQRNAHPATWFTMATPYAFLSATLRYHENEYRITPNQPLDLQYTVVLFDGILSREEINQFHKQKMIHSAAAK